MEVWDGANERWEIKMGMNLCFYFDGICLIGMCPYFPIFYCVVCPGTPEGGEVGG